MSATTRTFSNMLNEFLPNDLLKEEWVKRDYVFNRVEKDDSWLGGNMVVPFKAAGASSVAFGQLTAANDVSEDKNIRGNIAGAKEAWGTMIFNHRDIMEHDKLSEQNFLKLLPNTIEDFMDYFRNVISINMLSGAAFDKITADASANNGLVVVNRPDRWVIGQKVICVDPITTNTTTAYVGGINMNTKTITLWTTRAGTTVVDFSAGGATLLVANGSAFYPDGAQTAGNPFSSLRSMLLSATNGGDTTIYGVTKTLYPYTQAINVDGSTITAVNILEKLFDGLTTICQLGKGMPTELLMSYKNFGSAMKVIENSKGAFNVVPDSRKTSQYGWKEIEVGSVTKGGIKLVGVQEADDDVIMAIDWRAVKFYSNGLFQKRKSPDGNEYFEVRATTGYQYLVDICLFGELVVERPSYCGIWYGISYT